MVHLGKAEILKREVTQALNRLVRRESLLSNLVEELAQSLGIHRFMSL